MPAHQPYLAATPIASYPGLEGGNSSSSNSHRSPSWDDHYNQRGRSRSRSGASPSMSTARPRSADARPQYRSSPYNDKSPRCFDKMFYQQEEARARVAVPQTTTTPTYYPSQLPKASGVYHAETMYEDSHNPRRDYRRSLSPGGVRRSHSHDNNGDSRSSHYHNHPHVKYPLHPYQQHPISQSSGNKNDLLMYGELDSVTTGQSQQELLNAEKHYQQHQQRDSSRERRKEKKKIVNLPPSLFSTHSTRHDQQQQQRSRQLPPFEQPDTPEPLQDPDTNPRGRSYQREQQLESTGNMEKPEDLPIPYEKTPKQQKGWRSSMVKRLRNKQALKNNNSGGSSKRWRIIPSLSRSRSQSPGRTGKDSPLANPADDMGSTATSSRESDPVEEHPPRPLPPPSETTTVTSPIPAYDDHAKEWTIAQFKPPQHLEDVDATSDTVDFGTGRPRPSPSDERQTRRVGSGDGFGSSQPDNATPAMRSFESTTSSSLYTGSSSSTSSKPISYKQFTPKSRLAKYAMSRSNRNGDYSNATTYTEFEPFESENADEPRLTFSPYDSNSFVPPRPKDRSGAFPTLESSNPVATKQPNPKKVTNGPNSNLRSKVSPTSVVDMTNTSVRWSENLDQSPTPSRRNFAIERPKSILRSGRSASYNSADCPSDESAPILASKSVRISTQPQRQSSSSAAAHQDPLGFVDTQGRALSPIFGNSFDEGETPSDESPSVPEKQPPVTRWKDSGFEKSLPPEYQQAFLKQNALKSSKNDDDSGMISDAYVEFIEAVASVVVQTAARQFLAKARLRKLRQQKAESMARQQRSIEARHAANSRRKYAAHHRLEQQQQLGNTSQRIEELEKMIFELAAVRIQSAFRGWFARDCINVDNYCACIIQKNFRAHQMQKQYQTTMYRILLVQSFVRQRLAQEDAATRLYCILAIQAAFRGYLVRRNIQQWLQHRNEHFNLAATKIQAQWRSYYTEMEFLKTFEAVILIQCVFRGWWTRCQIRPRTNAHSIKAITSPGRPPKRVNDYKLPTNYFAHTEFMRRNLSFSRDTDDESSQPSVGNANRAARAEIGRRRKEKEDKRKAEKEEERQREEKRAAHAAQVEERKRRMEIMADQKRRQNTASFRGGDTSKVPSPPKSSPKTTTPYGRKIGFSGQDSTQQNVQPQKTEPFKDINQNAPREFSQNALRSTRVTPIVSSSVDAKDDSNVDSNQAVDGDQLQSSAPQKVDTGNVPVDHTVDSTPTMPGPPKKKLSVKEECAGASRVLAGWRQREQNQSGGTNGAARRFSGSNNRSSNSWITNSTNVDTASSTTIECKATDPATNSSNSPGRAQTVLRSASNSSLSAAESGIPDPLGGTKKANDSSTELQRNQAVGKNGVARRFSGSHKSPGSWITNRTNVDDASSTTSESKAPGPTNTSNAFGRAQAIFRSASNSSLSAAESGSPDQSRGGAGTKTSSERSTEAQPENAAPKVDQAKRRERIMQSLGIGPSYGPTDSDSSEEEDEELVEVATAAAQHAKAVPQVAPKPANINPVVLKPTPVKPVVLAKPTPVKPVVVVQPKPAIENIPKEANSPPQPKPQPRPRSTYYSAMEGKRSPSEQERIDRMHSIFSRVGLMSRQRKSNDPKAVAAQHPVDEHPEVMERQPAHSIPAPAALGNLESEQSASDIIRAWRGRDQTQPKMRGKLF